MFYPAAALVPDKVQQFGLPGFVASFPIQDPPTVVAAATGTAGNIGITWTAAANATTYNLYRGTTPGGEADTPVATGLTGTSTTDTGLTGGTTYYYFMRAVGPNGLSEASNETSATAGLQLPPTSVLATAGAAGVITLTWVAAASATTYNLYRGLTTGGESGTPVATGLTGTSHDDTGLANSTQFFYKMKAVGPAGTSVFSNETNATTITP